MRSLRVLLLVVVFAVIGVGVIQAADENGVPVFSDGRVNNWQIDAPVAVYCIFDHSQDVNVGVFQQIAVWGLSGNEILQASAAQIDSAASKFTATSTAKSKVVATDAVTLDSSDGYMLSLLKDGSFQVSAPNGYVFTWARGTTNC